MRTAIGILLFVVLYAPIAFMVFDELTGRRTRRTRPRPQPAAPGGRSRRLQPAGR